MVTVPSLLGMARALQGSCVTQRKAFWTMCAPQCEPWGSGDAKWDRVKGVEGLEKYNMALFEVVKWQAILPLLNHFLLTPNSPVYPPSLSPPPSTPFLSTYSPSPFTPPYPPAFLSLTPSLQLSLTLLQFPPSLQTSATPSSLSPSLPLFNSPLTSLSTHNPPPSLSLPSPLSTSYLPFSPSLHPPLNPPSPVGGG